MRRTSRSKRHDGNVLERPPILGGSSEANTNDGSAWKAPPPSAHAQKTALGRWPTGANLRSPTGPSSNPPLRRPLRLGVTEHASVVVANGHYRKARPAGLGRQYELEVRVKRSSSLHAPARGRTTATADKLALVISAPRVAVLATNMRPPILSYHQFLHSLSP